MKKVEKVSIGRYAFTLYEEAYYKASEYLDELSNYYSNREGGNEVMEGIEERMAELLLEKCGPGGIVSVEMISEVISILGRPESSKMRIPMDRQAPAATFITMQRKNSFATPPQGFWVESAAVWLPISI